ncbi:50S ribosomal protein L18 [Candidatus Woesebacteria bacterium]|nr:50S ribosomal protein L18 [Candidatus Woesebacteria bacterium]
MKKNNFLRRKKKVRAKISGTGQRPRLAVYRSNRYIYAQIIDDTKSETLVSASNLSKNPQKGAKVEEAKKVGQEIAKAALGKKIKKVVFDKSGYKYHGRLKALADAAREGGLEF